MLPKDSTQARLAAFASFFMAIVAVINVLVVIGWWIDNPLLASFGLGYLPMAPVTAIIFLGLCGLWLAQRVFKNWPGIRTLTMVVLLGILVLIIIIGIHHLMGIGPDIQGMLSANPPKLGQISSGRISPLTAAGFILVAMAFYLTTGREQVRQKPSVAAILSLIVLIQSGVNCLGYLYAEPLFYGGTFIPVALTTGLAFFFLSLSLLLIGGSAIWPVNEFVGPSLKARLMRIFIPVSVSIVLIQGFLSSSHGKWIINPVLSNAVATLVALAVVIILITVIARNLEAEILRGDRARMQAESTLRQSEGRFRTLVETAIDGIINIDREGHIVFWNSAAESIFGYSAGEMIGKPLDIIMPEGFHGPHREGLKRVDLTGESHLVGTTVELEGLRKGGHKFPMMLSLATWQVDGEVFYTGIVRDISERKRSEIVQNAIFRISQAAMTTEGMDALYTSIHSILRELIPAENIFIALYDSINNLLNFPYYIDQYDQKPPAPTELQGLTGYVIKTGRPLLATQEVFDRLVNQGEVEAVGTESIDWLGVPLKFEGRIIGVIAVQSYIEGTHYTREDMDLLEFVSTQVAQVIERKRLEEEVRSLSLTDELTGLYNRRGFTLLAEQELKLAHRKKRAMLLFFGDVDNLKSINDNLGHAEGDQALINVAGALKDSFREADVVARIGGDEFVVLALDASQESGEIMANRIQTVLKELNLHFEDSYHLTLSLGFARYDPEAPNSLMDLLAEADGLMYLQKQARKRTSKV